MMGTAFDETDIVATITGQAMAVLDSGRQLPPFSDSHAGFDLEAAYAVMAALRARREARGERPVGRKIGFTNRTIWAEYAVYAPMWGYVYDSTVRDLVAMTAPLDLSRLAEPRIEPEIVFGLAKVPRSDMSEGALFDCIGWVAHGFEIVQSIFPAWSFQAADTVAGYGLHGALLIGARHQLPAKRDAWRQALATFAITLSRDGAPADRGHAANVLDGPLLALKHLVTLLDRDPANPPLAAGEIVTTGTLTRAFPVAPGQTWTTALEGIDLDGLTLRL